MDAGFWSGRRVFLTGHTGFKGGWLSLLLGRLGAEVWGYALSPNTEPNLYGQARLSDALATSTIADIRDAGALRVALQAARPEVIFHLAAQPLVRDSYVDPVGTYGTNVMGTVNLLDSVRKSPSVRAVVVVTTDKCYENREWMWGYRETDALGGRDPYSGSKACAELVTATYRQSFFQPNGYSADGVAVASARAGNVIGGGDWSKDRLIPDVVRALAASAPIVLRNPQATRPWQHVLDPLWGYIMLAQKLSQPGGHKFAEAWNFGPELSENVCVRDIVHTLAGKWGGQYNILETPDKIYHESENLKLDISKSTRLGWRPRLDLHTSLDWLIEWERCWHRGGDVRQLTRDQIEKYLSLIYTRGVE